ncbi:MAG: glutamine amidotransferase [Nitrospinota bacterium]|nr:glutamine amidotransferase [Nitrospinota bacterium]
MNWLASLLGEEWSEYNAWELHWTSDVWGGTFVFLGVLIVLSLWFFWTSLARVRSPWKKIFLYTLRVIVLLLVALVVLQPRLEFKKIQPLKNTIAVLIDDSKSMTIKTFPSEKPRGDLVRKVMVGNKDYFETLKQNYEVDFFFASDQINPVPLSNVITNYQEQAVNTDLHQVFLDMTENYEGKSLQGVLLFSDGADLAQDPSGISREFTETLTRLNGPVYTFQAGSNEGFKDLAIEKVDATDFGFIHQPLNITVTVSARSIGKKNIPLVLKEGDKILVSKIVSLKEKDSQYTAELQFTPASLGKRIYTLSVPVFSGEAVEINNRWSFEVKVIRDRVRVLHLNGRPSWDSRFLRETLANNPKVDLLSFFILRTLTDDVGATTSELSLIPFPSNLLFSDYLNSFDLVVFQNFKFSPFIDKKNLPNIKEYVEQGGAFLMIGGDLSFEGGGYDRTPVEEILPMSIRGGSKKILLGELPMKVQPKLSHHPVLQLENDPEKNARAWKSLPPIQGVNVGLVPAKDSHVLSTAWKNKANHPVLVTRQVKEGRTMAIATDSSWNWNFLRVGEGGSGRYYQKFWENVIAWMTREPETNPIQVETDKEKYREHEKVVAHFKVRGQDYNPLPGVEVDLVLNSLPRERELVRETVKTDEHGEGRFEFAPGREGFYSAKVSLTSGGEVLSGETRFIVFSPQIEFQKPLVNETLLQSLSKVTGGSHHVLEEGLKIANLTFPNPEVEIKSSSRMVSLWNSWWTYALIVGFLVVEWWTRRKSGLS